MGFQRDDYQVGVCKHEAATKVPSESGGSTVQGCYPLSNWYSCLNQDNQISQYFGVLLSILEEYIKIKDSYFAYDDT